MSKGPPVPFLLRKRPEDALSEEALNEQEAARSRDRKGIGQPTGSFLSNADAVAQQARKQHLRKDPKKHEAIVAAAVSGKRQPGSGAFEGLKGDVEGGTYGLPLLLECKRTKGASLRVESAWLKKITEEALSKNKHPALAMQFGEGNIDWVAIPLTRTTTAAPTKPARPSGSCGSSTSPRSASSASTA